MPEKSNRRKERVPLSPEELHYFIKLKKLKKQQQLEEFKATDFYKIISYCNIFLIALVTYFVLTILISCSWSSDKITALTTTRGEYNRENQQRTVSDVIVSTPSITDLHIVTQSLYQEPAIDQTIFIGKDWIFRKTLKAKFQYDDRAFWENKTYPALLLCSVSLIISLFVYKANLHLTFNGLLTTLAMLSLSSLYFIFV